MADKWAGWLHNPAVWGVPNASERGTESEVAHKWAKRLYNRAASGVPSDSQQGDKNQQ